MRVLHKGHRFLLSFYVQVEVYSRPSGSYSNILVALRSSNATELGSPLLLKPVVMCMAVLLPSKGVKGSSVVGEALPFEKQVRQVCKDNVSSLASVPQQLKLCR